MRISRTQEEHLLNQANNLINKLQVKEAFVMNINSSAMDFSLAIRGTGILSQIESFIFNMNDSSIMEMIRAAVKPEDRFGDYWRSTFCQDVLWECNNIFKKTDDAQSFLQELAMAVLIAAMYDILMTESWIMNVEEGSVDESLVVYEPKPMMKIYVRSVRLHDLLQ
jgi:hypothetical protein